jgi:hypothetical protein
MYNTPGRFSKLNKEELYVLKRALCESSYTFFMLDKYSKEEQQIHNALLNEIVGEIKNKPIDAEKVIENWPEWKKEMARFKK